MLISCGGSRSDFQDEQAYFLHNSQVMVFLFAAEEGCACSCFAHYSWFPVSGRLPVSCVSMFPFSWFPVFSFSVLSRFLFSYPVCFLIFSSFSMLSFPADFFSDWNLRCDTPRLGLFVEWYFDKISKKDPEGLLERFLELVSKKKSKFECGRMECPVWNSQARNPCLQLTGCVLKAPHVQNR